MTDAATTWKRLRLKVDPTTDDTDWRGTAVTPNTATAVVGGTTSVGVYSITVVGKLFKPGTVISQSDVDFTASFTRVAENDATIAGELEDDFDAGTLSTSNTTLLSAVGITADVASSTITIRFPPYFYGTMTAGAPGTATITFPLGSAFPITASAPHFSRGGSSSLNGVTVMWNCMDDAGATLLAPGTGTQPTMTIQAIEIAEVETVDSRGDRTYRYVTGATAVLAATEPGTPYELPLRGAKYWTLRMLADANLTANTDSVEVIWRDSAT